LDFVPGALPLAITSQAFGLKTCPLLAKGAASTHAVQQIN
jgi:hypothetical protein